MDKLEKTTNSEGNVKVNGAVMQSLIDELHDRFNNLLQPYQIAMVDHMISLYDDLSAMEYGLLTEKGWESFTREMKTTQDTLDEMECSIELTPEALKRLEQIYSEEKKNNPELTIEDLLSKTILGIPMPE